MLFLEYPQQYRIIVQNLTFVLLFFLFFSLTRNPFSFLLLICTKYVALRAALESTVYGSVTPYNFFFLFSSTLFFFFGTIFEMHSQSSSTNLLRVHAHRVPGSRRITRRNSARLLYYRRSLKLPCSMPECYLSDLFLLNFCILQFFSFSSRNEPPAVKRIATAVATDRSWHDRIVRHSR